LMILLLITALGSCSVVPTDSTIELAITDYFERNQYKVVKLEIGKIEGIPLFEKTYMGTPGYVVEVLSITLEAQADKGIDIKKGDQLTFSNAKIRVRQDPVHKTAWHVSIISGINVL
jgi:hypothetical protein